MKIFSLGGDVSVYAADFHPHPLPVRETSVSRSLARMKEAARDTPVLQPRPPTQVWWTTPCFSKMRAEERPPFTTRSITTPVTRPPVRIGAASKEDAKANPLYPEIKLGLKKCLAQLDANLERFLEFSDPDHLKPQQRAENVEGAQGGLGAEERTERRWALGYTGHVPSCVLLKRGLHTSALDPAVSLYQAGHLRNNEKVENTDPSIREKFERLPLDKLRIAHGVTYVPVAANYSNDISNLPSGKDAL